MKCAIFCIFGLFATSLLGLSDQSYERWSKAGSTWHERWSNLADQASLMGADERIELFSPALMSNEGATKYKNEDLELYNRVQKILVQTPGHADFHARRIKAAQLAYEQAIESAELGKTSSEEIEGPSQSKLLYVQMRSFQALGNMPSPETVRVLGEFLFDPWGLDPDAKPPQFPNKEKLGQVSHAEYAMVALARLPLETRANATPPEETRYWENIDAWKLWYQQIRAGTRTFRFKGDSQEYSLAGPVAKAVEPGVNRSEAVGGSAPSQEALAKPSKLPVAALAGAIVLLMAAIWVVMKKRLAAAGG